MEAERPGREPSMQLVQKLAMEEATVKLPTHLSPHAEATARVSLGALSTRDASTPTIKLAKPSSEIVSCHCFKLLSFGLVCYTVMESRSTSTHLPEYMKVLSIVAGTQILAITCYPLDSLLCR